MACCSGSRCSAGAGHACSSQWPAIYALSLAVYCTSWTFFGTVTQAARYDRPLPPTLVGTIALYVLGVGVLVKLLRQVYESNATCNHQHLTFTTFAMVENRPHSQPLGLIPYLRSFPIAFVLILAAYIALTAYFAVLGPRVPVREGLGWDGRLYGACAIDLHQCIVAGKLSAYTLGRLFPSAAIHAFFSTVNMHPGPSEVVLAFSLWNLLCAWLGVALWLDCGRRLGFNAATTFFGLSALFINFAMTRLIFFAPVSTDYSAFAFAMLGLWIFVAGRRLLLLIPLIPAGMTWPVAALGLASIAIIRQNTKVQPESGSVRREMWLGTATPILLAVIYCTFAVYFLWIVPQAIPSGGMQINSDFLFISIPLCAAYVFWAARSICLALPWRYLRLSWKAALAALLAIAVYWLATRFMTSFATTQNPINFAQLIRGLTVTGLVYPAHPVAAHVMFLGPWTVALLALLPVVWSTAVARAAPLVPILLLATVFFLLTESRVLTFYVPFVVFILCLTLRNYLSERTALCYAIAALLCSHFWLPMPRAPFGILLESPAQTMFMHIGPWMAWRGYFIGLLQTAVAIGLLLLLNRDRRRAGTQCTAGRSAVGLG